jgi:hypothetical protein
MRIRSLLALASLSLPAAAPVAQNVGANCDNYISTQAEADAFDCSSLAGLLQIGGGDITDLGGLSELTSVGGDLFLGSTSIADLNGLDGLTSVGGDVTITANLSLTSFSGLAALDSIGGDFVVGANDALTSIDGLAGLTTIGGALRILGNNALLDVDGFSDLTTVGRFVEVTGNYFLDNLDGLAGLTAVGDGSDGFYITSNRYLARCAVGLGPILTADLAAPSTIDGTNTFFGNGTLLTPPATTDCSSAADILAAYAQPPSALPLASPSLSYAGNLVLPAGSGSLRVTASATHTAATGQRYTVFLRLDGPGGFSRIAFRGEIKPQAGESVSQSIKLKTKASDPSGAYTVSLIAEQGSVAAPGAGAEVIATLPATKLGGALHATEALSAYPNPAASAATLRFAVAEAGEATLAVYDALGREVARPVDGAVAGVVEASFDASALPAGVYVARLTTGAGTETVRLTVVR